MESLVNDATETGLLADLKSYPGRLGLETLLREITKLKLVRDLNLPSALFDGVSPRIVELWGARSTRAYRSDLLGSTRPVLLTLPATVVLGETHEITDALVDLLLGLVHKIMRIDVLGVN